MYYDIKQLIAKGKELDAPFISAIGGKGNGKTFSSIDYAIREFFEINRPFVYLRRLDKMTQKTAIQTLLNPHLQTIINLSHGRYNNVRYRSGTFEVIRKSPDGKKVDDSAVICFCRALSNIESQTGADFGEISCVIYDEFLSREHELPDEFNKMMIAHNNYTRNRTHYYIPFILLGNTVSRDNVILTQFGVDARTLKQGEITAIYNTKHEIRLLIEYCARIDIMMSADEKYYARFENERINMITNGSWTVSQYKTYPYNINALESVITYRFIHDKIIVDCRICSFRNNYILFITKNLQKYDSVIWISDTLPISKTKIIKRMIDKSMQFMINAIATKQFYTDDNFAVDDIRDICKHIVNGESIRKWID